MATKRVKSAVPRAANSGVAARTATSRRVRLRMRMVVSLEAVPEVDGDQVRVGFVSPVEVVAAPELCAARLEVQHELGGVNEERTAPVADAERSADAVGVGQQRSNDLGRLRITIVDRAEPDVPVRTEVAVGPEAVGEGALPVLLAREAELGCGGEVDGERFEAAPVVVDEIELDVPVLDGAGGDAEVGEIGEGNGGGDRLGRRQLGGHDGIELRVACRDLCGRRRPVEID